MTNLADIEVSTGSRLHFGLLTFGKSLDDNEVKTYRFHSEDENHNSFGGIGLMLKQPNTVIQFRNSDRLEIAGDQFGRAKVFTKRWHQFVSLSHGLDQLLQTEFESLPVQIHVKNQPPEHSGLGAGTQLALSLAFGLFRFFCKMDVDPKTLSNSVGRGLRSAVGTHGFYRGGFLVDRGKPDPAELGILDGHFPIPSDWRVVLISPCRVGTSVSGEKERNAFRELPPIPSVTTTKLTNLIHDTIVPALIERDFESFSEGIYQYGYSAGMCFQSVQGGPFANRRSDTIVELLRRNRVSGVGQSSWGPTLFAFASSQNHAENICQVIEHSKFGKEVKMTIQECKNTGVDVRPLS